MTPELLSPAGNLEKLKLAIDYGADAVYLGLQKFGLRSAAENFSLEELSEATKYAHQHSAKAFVVLNAYLHDKDLEELPPYLKEMSERGVDALIVSDLGVIETVKKHCDIPIHLSTQASCLNSKSAKLWKSMGAERIVLGREISLAEAKNIKEKVDIELEMFVHGSMCMAFSGNCVISNYTQGRDSNRGGCAHSCRFKYSLDIPGQSKTKNESFFMSSKDLKAISYLGDFIEAGIDSLKVEGRMKNHLYVATVTGAYRKAIDAICSADTIEPGFFEELDKELANLANRDYTTASLLGKAGDSSISRDIDRPSSSHQIVGKILEQAEGKVYFLSKAGVSDSETLELVNFNESDTSFKANSLFDIHGNRQEKTKPNRIYYYMAGQSSDISKSSQIIRRRL